MDKTGFPPTRSQFTTKFGDWWQARTAQGLCYLITPQLIGEVSDVSREVRSPYREKSGVAIASPMAVLRNFEGLISLGLSMTPSSRNEVEVRSISKLN
jgi:hypothetical protein